jgi:hypothetical protein
MDGKQAASAGTITSIDGTRTITVEEFDQLFDDASDEIDQFIDWSKGRMVGGGFEVRVGRHDTAGAELAHLHLPRDAAE